MKETKQGTVLKFKFSLRGVSSDTIIAIGPGDFPHPSEPK